MKRIKHICIVWVLLLCGVALEAGTPKTQHIEGLLLAEEFSDALVEMQSLESAGYGSASLYYQMGYAHQRLDQCVDALYYYEKALKYRLSPKRVKPDIDQCHNQLDLPWKPSSQFVGLRAWLWMRNLLSSNLWFGLLASILLLWSLIFYRSTRENDRHSLHRQLLVIIGFLLLVMASLGASRYAYERSSDEGVIVTEAYLHAAPEKDSPMIRTIPLGTKIKILEEFEGCKLVLLPNLEEGWLLDTPYRTL